MNYINELVDIAIKEDIGDGDHTSLSCIPKDAIGKAHLLVKEAGVIAGVELAQDIFKKIDPELIFSKKINDGELVNIGDIVFTVEGNSQAILQAERLALNFMQRMSGIATTTKQYVNLLDGLHTKVLDTRKTTPGLRHIEKWAVKIGGGVNHRIGLYDMIMIKDNHVDYAGGIKEAITSTTAYLKKNNKALKIEIEARDLNELNEILAVGGIDRIMLDNFSFEDMHTAVELIDGKYETEASGGITSETIRRYAECGVDFISVGALTHQIKSLDLSLKAI
jgi:nicotinate-nucleotide pyrophosphorylase (carboxylating)